MNLAKEIEFIVLNRIVQKGEVSDKDFNHLFEDKNFEYNLALSRIIKTQLDQIPEISGEYAELRRRTLLRERNHEVVAGELKESLHKHSVIVKSSTRFLIIASLVTVFAAFFLIQLDSKIHPVHSKTYRTAMTK